MSYYLYPLQLPPNGPLVTVTNPKSSVWVIELHNGTDSRLTDTLIDGGLKPALDVVERHWRERWRAAANLKASGSDSADKRAGTLIIVGNRKQEKFFSNGLDFAKASVDPNFFPKVFNPMLARILTFPIPTIAAINGHCFAGGFILTLACDYRVMNYRVMTDGSKRNAWLCMNEVHFGAMWRLSFAAIVRAKVGDGRLQRKIALEGHRFSPNEALDIGLIDYIVSGNTEAVLAKAEAVADSVGSLAKEGVWGIIKTTLYRDTLEDFRRDTTPSTNALDEDEAAKARL